METLLAVLGWPLGFLKLYALSRWIEKFHQRHKFAWVDAQFRLQREERRCSEVERLRRGSSRCAARYLLEEILLPDAAELRAELLKEIERFETKRLGCALQFGNSELCWRSEGVYVRAQHRILERLKELDVLEEGWRRSSDDTLVGSYLNCRKTREDSLRASLTALSYLCACI